MATRRTRTAGDDAAVQVEERRGDKREAIIDAARDLFTSAGYEKTTIADVARQARIAVGTVYLYFKSKPDLLHAIKSDWECQLLVTLDKLEITEQPLSEIIRPVIQICFDTATNQSDVMQLMGLQSQEVGSLWEDGNGEVDRWLRQLLDRAVAIGMVRAVDTKTAAIMIYSMVKSAMQQCFVADQGKNQQHYIDMVVDALERWLTPDKSA